MYLLIRPHRTDTHTGICDYICIYRPPAPMLGGFRSLRKEGMNSPFLPRSMRTLRGRCRHEKYSYAFRARYVGIAGGSISIAQAAIADVTAGRTRTELGLIGAIRRDHNRAVFGGVLSDLVRFMVYRLNAVPGRGCGDFINLPCSFGFARDTPRRMRCSH